MEGRVEAGEISEKGWEEVFEVVKKREGSIER